MFFLNISVRKQGLLLERGLELARRLSDVFLLVFSYFVLYVLLAFGVVEREVDLYCLFWLGFVDLGSESTFLLLFTYGLYLFPFQLLSRQLPSVQQCILHIDLLLRLPLHHHVLHDLVFGPLSKQSRVSLVSL